MKNDILPRFEPDKHGSDDAQATLLVDPETIDEDLSGIVSGMIQAMNFGIVHSIKPIKKERK